VIPVEWFERANERIRPHVVRTPLTYDPRTDLYLKWENHQVTGSFKARGALNKVLSLEDWERAPGLVAASAGNHGQGIALAAGLTKTAAQVFVPRGAVATKVDAIRAMGAEITYVDGGYGETEEAAKQLAARSGRLFISPYNDGQVIAGQGTIAMEVVEQLRTQYKADHRRIATWIFPTGGGGLISGCGAALAALGGHPFLVGVQPEESAFTYSLIKRGTQTGVPDNPTLADGLSGALDGASITIPLMRELMQDIVTVSEEAIARAIARAWWDHGEKIEGSAAVALAAALEGSAGARPAVVVLSGGNIDAAVFEGIVAKYAQGAQT
jgi:threonine dehydratase